MLDWELGPDDYAALSTLPFQQRMVNGAMWLVSVRAEGRGGLQVLQALLARGSAPYCPTHYLRQSSMRLPRACLPALSLKI